MLVNELIQSYCMPHRLHAMLHVVHRAARASRVEGRPGNVGRHRPALGRPAARNPGTRAEMSTPNGRVPHSFRGEVGLPGAYTIRSVYGVPHYTLHTSHLGRLKDTRQIKRAKTLHNYASVNTGKAR